MRRRQIYRNAGIADVTGAPKPDFDWLLVLFFSGVSLQTKAGEKMRE